MIEKNYTCKKYGQDQDPEQDACFAQKTDKVKKCKQCNYLKVVKNVFKMRALQN